MTRYFYSLNHLLCQLAGTLQGYPLGTRVSHLDAVNRRAGWMVVIMWMLAATLQASAAQPIIFQALDPVKPDETFLLFGADVGATATAEGLRLPDKAVSSPPASLVQEPSGKAEALRILDASDLSAKVLIPADWKPGVFAVRLHNTDGAGEWQFANRPQLWWQISGDGGRASPGGELRVFGKNLGQRSRLWLVNAKGVAREIPVKVARDYDVTCELPKDLATGSYQAWLHNGFGGVAGFGEPLSLDVETAPPWPDTVFDVTKYGAQRDGEHDDTEAIRSALKAAEANGGGVVYLPSATYIVTGKMVVPKRTILRGEKRESVWIKVPVYWPKAPQKLADLDTVIAGNGYFGVENLSIVAQPTRRILAAPDLPQLYGPGMARLPAVLPSADQVHIRNVRFEHLYFAHRPTEDDPRRSIFEGPSSIVVYGADFLLEHSEIVSAGMPIQIQAAKRAKIVHNSLRTGRNGWYGLENFSQGLFEGNDISGADLEGSYGGVGNSAIELFIRDNHWHDAYGGEREALTFDGPYLAAWFGSAAVNGKELAFCMREPAHWPPSPNYPKDLYAVVAQGRGLGQAAQVAEVTKNGVILAQRFKITPDASSTIAIVARKTRVIITENLVEDASVAFQLYSQSREFIIARNRSVRTGGSYAMGNDVAESGNRHRYSYALFNQWLDNSFAEGLVYEQGPWSFGFVGIHAGRFPGSENATSAIGNRFVGNRLEAGTRMGVSPPVSRMDAGMSAYGVDTIFEGNESREPVLQSLAFSHTLLRNNQTVK